MGDLKPIGSERLKGDDKMKRILELTYYNNENKTAKTSMGEYITESINGVFGIVKEKDGYYVKKGINENSLDYIGGLFMKNKNRFHSYAEAFKRLDLLKGQEILEEEKKYILKVNNSKPAESTPPMPDMSELPGSGTPSLPPEGMSDTTTEPAPEMGSTGDAAPEMGTTGDVPPETGDENLPEPENGEDSSDDDSDPIKSIEKLTGRLGQKLRDAEESMDSKDIKYVLNSIISAVNLGSLDDDDAEDVRNKLDNSDVDDEEDFEPESSPDAEMPTDNGNPEGVDDELGETIDTLENLTNTSFDMGEEDDDVPDEYGQTKQTMNEPCSWCGYRYGHATGCPEKENNTETNEFDIDEEDFNDSFTFDKEDENEIDAPMDNSDEFEDFEDDSDEFENFEDDSDEFEDFDDEIQSKEIDITELTDMINNSVKQTLGGYFK